MKSLCNITKEFSLNPFDHPTSNSDGRRPKNSAILEDRMNYGIKKNLKWSSQLEFSYHAINESLEFECFKTDILDTFSRVQIL